MSVRWGTHSGFSVRSGFIHKWKTKAPNTYWCSKNMNPSNVVCYHNVHPHSNSKCARGVLFLGELTPYVGFQWYGAPVGSHVWTQPRVSSSPGEMHVFAEHHWDVAWGWRKWCPRICRTSLSVKHWKSPCIFHLQWQKIKHVPSCSEIPKSYVSLLWHSETQVYMTYALALKYLHLTGEPNGESDLWPM